MTKHIFWLASYPKSGNTLTRLILAALFFSKEGRISLDLIKYISNYESTRNLNFIKKININDFSENIKDCILIGSDKQLKDFASEKLNYNHKKGLDFIARKNNKYIVGEQKLITDQGGNQDKSIADIERLLSTNLINCTKLVF